MMGCHFKLHQIVTHVLLKQSFSLAGFDKAKCHHIGVTYGKDLRVASVNKKLTIHKELSLLNNHVNLEADPYPAEFLDEASTLVDTLTLVRDSEAESPDKTKSKLLSHRYLESFLECILL